MENQIEMKKVILDKIEKLKEKNILVEVEFLDTRNKFNVYSSSELNALKARIKYIPKNFFLKEDNYYLKNFINFLSSLDSKAEKIDFLLKDLDGNSNVALENVEYNSYFHFTENKVIINIDSYGKDIAKFKELLSLYDKEPKAFIKNIVSNNLLYDFNDLMKNGKMRYFNSSIYSVKVKGNKYIVFNTSNYKEKIMYILNENDEYLDILDERYLKILKKLSLIVNL